MPDSMILLATLVSAALAAGVSAVFFAPRLPGPARMLTSMLFVAGGLYCTFGLVASLEPIDGQAWWQGGYAIMLGCCVMAVFRLLTVKASHRHQIEA